MTVERNWTDEELREWSERGRRRAALNRSLTKQGCPPVQWDFDEWSRNQPALPHRERARAYLRRVWWAVSDLAVVVRGGDPS